MRDEGVWSGVAKDRAAWIRKGLELRDADIWSIFGKARTEMAK